MDPATLTCSKCSQPIKKNKKGEFFKFCGQCGTPVVVPERLEVILCPGCGEGLERDSGMFPNYCPECRFDIHVTNCSNIDCGEKIEREETGKFPPFCGTCGKPVVALQSSCTASSPKEAHSRKIETTEAGSAQNVSQAILPNLHSEKLRDDKQSLSCPNPQCQLPINKNRKGIFPKYCAECNHQVPDHLRLPVVQCPNHDCGVLIKRNRRKMFPKYCAECDEPFQKCPNFICSYTTNTTKGEVPQHCPKCSHSFAELRNEGMV